MPSIKQRNRQTCRLLNLIELHKGLDISEEIKDCIAKGADLTLKRKRRYSTGTNCDSYNYDIFDISENICGTIYTAFRPYYPIWFAIKQHCHPNVIKTLYDISGAFKNISIEETENYSLNEYQFNNFDISGLKVNYNIDHYIDEKISNYNLNIDQKITLELIFVSEFGPLYFDPFFIEEAKNSESYYYKLKQLADEYIKILELDPSKINYKICIEQGYYR
jgi:hypothetical protein